MPLVFAAITPHPPLLVPDIGKDATVRAAATVAALAQLEEQLYLARPQYIIIASPHTGCFPEAFVVNNAEKFTADFKRFGDLTTTASWSGAPEFAAVLSHTVGSDLPPVRLIHRAELDYGASIPLLSLTKHIPEAKIIPIGFSALPTKDHLQFGEMIKEQCLLSNKRIAFIASGDLSHTLYKDSPGGFHRSGAEFDRQLISLLESRNTVGLANLDAKLIAEAEECAYRSVMIALGVLKNTDFTFKNYCYEAPFGIGYLTGQFIF